MDRSGDTTASEMRLERGYFALVAVYTCICICICICKCLDDVDIDGWIASTMMMIIMRS
jgi:hypothetical protein